MVYISSWQEYQEAAEALYAGAPSKTRYCVRWNGKEGKLVLKITDDTTCLKYKTHSSIYLNRFEALNLTLMQKMQNVVARVGGGDVGGGGGGGEGEGRAGTPVGPSASGPASPTRPAPASAICADVIYYAPATATDAMPRSPMRTVDADGDVSLSMATINPSAAITSSHHGLGAPRAKRGPSALDAPSDGAVIVAGASPNYSHSSALQIEGPHYRPYKRPKLDEPMHDIDDDGDVSASSLFVPSRHSPRSRLRNPDADSDTMPASFPRALSASPGKTAPSPPSISPNRSPFSPQPPSLSPGPTSHSIWFEDGDIVLGVHDVVFRVHAVRLIAAAGAFANLLSGPRPLPGDREGSARAADEIARKVRDASGSAGGGAEYVDGCPFVSLEGDTPRDWVVALEAIYDFLTFQVRPVIFDTLAGALRISTKYDIRFLREWAIAQMRTTWPMNLDQMAPMALPHAADAITLARLCDVPEILPAAFYALSVQKWRTGADGGRAHAVLSPADLRRLVAGREALQDVLVEIVAAPLTLSPSMGITPGSSCDITSVPGVMAKVESYWSSKAARFSRLNMTYPPSPAPSPSPQSPTIAPACAQAPASTILPSGVPPPPPVATPPPVPPCFEFCPAYGPGAAPCRAVLDIVWRRALAPDPRRAWGTWLIRELYRMATLPRSSLALHGPDGGMNGYGSVTACGPPGSVYEYDRAWGGGGGWPPGEGGGGEGANGPGGGGGAWEGPGVCVRCSEENRRLALWRLDWLCVAIPGMFML
ncbi:hypothetical protein M0805_009397 [Coniferiporia weirii]|nr:hypothetical protein M0805_009397 [Coniferiporia weirii]